MKEPLNNHGFIWAVLSLFLVFSKRQLFIRIKINEPPYTQDSYLHNIFPFMNYRAFT